MVKETVKSTQMKKKFRTKYSYSYSHILEDGKNKVGGWTDWEKYSFPANV
jgi:hypothetical protein